MKPGQPRRDTQKAREWAQRRSRSLSTRSASKASQRATEKAIRERVFARDGGCVLAGRTNMPCCGPLTPHHRRKASAGGAYTEENLVACCLAHNGDIEERPRYYRRLFPEIVVREGDPEFEGLGRRAARHG